MYILCCLLPLLLYTTTLAMDHQIERWEQQEFWDLADNDNQHNEEIIEHDRTTQRDNEYQRYLNENPLFLPISRRKCLATAICAGIFLPPIIASQPTLQSQLVSLPPEVYIAGAAIVTSWTTHELKKLIELIKKNNDNSDSEDDIFDELY